MVPPWSTDAAAGASVRLKAGGSAAFGVLVATVRVEAGWPGDGPLPITTDRESAAVLPARSLAITLSVWTPSVTWAPSHVAVAVMDLAGGLGVDVTLSGRPSTVTVIVATPLTASSARTRIATETPGAVPETGDGQSSVGATLS